MAYGIDSQINERVDTYSSDPQKLMQRYTQSQSLLDLLALQKLKSEKEAAMRNMQTQMQPPMNTVRDQREQQVLDMTRNEVAQQAMQGGQQLALNKQREMQARGLPAQAAPNMQGMADGGIVGYQEGGFMGPPEANMLQRMGQGLKNYGANAQESMGILKEAKAGMGIPYGERSAVMKQVRDEIEAQNQNRDPNFIERMGQKLMDTGLDVEESKAILKKFYNNMGKTYEEMSNGMADGGIVGYNSRGSVNLLEAALEAEGITDPATIALIRSIYAQESSSGQNTGVSPAGARGPMQVMPGTFTEMMGPDADINDPMTNLRAGSRYAQQMLARAEGDPRLAAAGYYGGPGGMDTLRAGNDVIAPQDGFPNVSTYADEVMARMGDSGRAPETSKPIIPLGALFEAIGKGRDALFSPSRASQEASDIRRDEVEQAAARGANMFDILPAPERLSSAQLAGLGAIDFTGSMPTGIQQQREADLESGLAAQKLETERTSRIENNAAPPVDTDRVRAEQYMGSDQQVDDMMSDIYRGVEPEAPAPKGDGLAGLAQAMTPSRLQELRKRREDLMGGITSPERLQRDKLRAYVSGLGQTGLGGGAEAFTREQQRQDALQVGDLDRLIELEREDEKLQREINASMAEVVANNEAELAQLLMNTSLKDRLEQAGDRRKFISDVLKQVQKDSIMNPALMALEKAKKDGDITRDAYETQRLSIIMEMISGLPAGYDIENIGTGLGGSVFTSGSFD